MATVVLRPVSRSVTPGSTATFAVQVADGTAKTLVVRPDGVAHGYGVHFAGGGPEAPGGPGRQVLTVEVPRGAGMA